MQLINQLENKISYYKLYSTDIIHSSRVGNIKDKEIPSLMMIDLAFCHEDTGMAIDKMWYCPVCNIHIMYAIFNGSKVDTYPSLIWNHIANHILEMKSNDT